MVITYPHWCVSVTHRIGGSRNQMETFAPAPVWNRRTASIFLVYVSCCAPNSCYSSVYCLPPLDQMWSRFRWLFDKSGFKQINTVQLLVFDESGFKSSNGSVPHNYLFSCKECLVTPNLSISRWRRTGITNASVPCSSMYLAIPLSDHKLSVSGFRG